MKEDGFGAIIISPCFYTENFLTRQFFGVSEIVKDEDKFHIIVAGGSLEAYYLKKIKEDLKVPVVIMGGTAIKTGGLWRIVWCMEIGAIGVVKV